MLKRIDELRIFVQVIDSGSLTAAARAMDLTIHQVSRRLAALEERLGTTLVHRSTRSLAASDEGQRVYAGALRILAEVEATERLLTRDDQLHGNLRLAIPGALAQGAWLERLYTLLGEHPDLSVDLMLVDTGVDVIAGGFDLALFVGVPPASSLIGLHLGRIRPTMCATPAYLDRRGRPQHPDDLADHDTLRFVADRGQSHWTLLHESGEEVTVAVKGQLASNDSRLLFNATQNGWGIGLYPSWLTYTAVNSLEEVLPGWRFSGFPVYAMLPPARRGDPRTRAVLEATREALAPVFDGHSGPQSAA